MYREERLPMNIVSFAHIFTDQLYHTNWFSGLIKYESKTFPIHYDAETNKTLGHSPQKPVQKPSRQYRYGVRNGTPLLRRTRLYEQTTGREVLEFSGNRYHKGHNGLAFTAFASSLFGWGDIQQWYGIMR